MDTIAYKQHIDTVIERIEMARVSVSEHHIVKIVAVSKYSTIEEIEALYNIGQRAFGENKVQDLSAKSEALDALPLEWHFIGNLQKNKINQLIRINPYLFHGLDSLELAKEIDKRLSEPMECLLQVNSAKEESKHGVMPEMAKDIYDEIESTCSNIHLRGLMSIGAHSDDEKTIAQSFETTKKIYDTLKGADILSMGMSSDFELAIKCGSNMVRLGSIMFNR